eukprot:COSAG06_NODE_4978_length_3814_cov_5.280754_2_plen_134_part_00
MGDDTLGPPRRRHLDSRDTMYCVASTAIWNGGTVKNVTQSVHIFEKGVTRHAAMTGVQAPRLAPTAAQSFRLGVPPGKGTAVRKNVFFERFEIGVGVVRDACPAGAPTRWGSPSRRGLLPQGPSQGRYGKVVF